jgi:hypothetical protein
VLDHAVLPILSECDSYEDLHCLDAGMPSAFALPVLAWLGNNFSGRWIGFQGPTERPSCDFSFFNVGLGRRRNLSFATKHTL